MTSNHHHVSRHRSRSVAFQFLFSALPEKQTTDSISFNHVQFKEFIDSFHLQTDDFTWEIVDGVGKNLPIIDAEIQRLSEHWRIERMPKVDLTLLRLSIFELLFRADIPKSVSINEAIELAKEYGEKESPSFINGILDKISKHS